MDKKKIFIGLGIIAVIGGIFYFYNKSKNTQTGNTGGDTTGGDTTDGDTTGGENKSADAVTPATETAKVLTTRKEKKKACGRRPVLKKKRAEWQKCVDAGGTSGFEGDFDEFEETYMDFDNNFDVTF